jgi:hypothetical protein
MELHAILARLIVAAREDYSYMGEIAAMDAKRVIASL